jgi:hypothetical protein
MLVQHEATPAEEGKQIMRVFYRRGELIVHHSSLPHLTSANRSCRRRDTRGYELFHRSLVGWVTGTCLTW